MSAEWYQRKLAEMRRQQPQQPQQYQQRGYPQQPSAPVQQRSFPPQQQAPALPGPQEERTWKEALTAPPGWVAPSAKAGNASPCPKCGSGNYFPNVATSRRGPAPAGHCFECGYNDGMFDQGDVATWSMGVA